MDRGGVRLTFQQAHDDRAYYGLVRLSGPWKHLRITLDGEGEGVFSGRGVEYLEVTRAAEPDAAPSIRKPPYARAVVGVAAAPPEPAAGGDGGGDGSAAFEFSLPNRGEGPWFWDKAGREIGVAIEVRDDEGRVYSVYEPYRLFYARMLERAGRDPLPPGAPAELTREQATRVLLPGDPALKITGTGWKRGKKTARPRRRGRVARLRRWAERRGLRPVDALRGEAGRDPGGVRAGNRVPQRRE
jgi:hypothetical protein